jgi:hypothetical protein
MFVKALDTAKIHTRRRIRYMAVMGKLCSACCILPTSHNLTRGLEVLGEEPYQSGGFAEVWMGKYDGRLVAVKALKTYSSGNPLQIKKASRRSGNRSGRILTRRSAILQRGCLMEAAVASKRAPFPWGFYIAVQVCYGLCLDASREHCRLCQIPSRG